jgi:hypothetical protein
VPVRRIAEELKWDLAYDAETHRVSLKGLVLKDGLKHTLTGRTLIDLGELRNFGVRVEFEGPQKGVVAEIHDPESETRRLRCGTARSG